MNGKLYFFDKNAIFSYNISDHSSIKLHGLSNCSRLFFFQGNLCSIYANLIQVFKKDGLQLKLKHVPKKIIQDADGVGFLYEDSMEILTSASFSLRNIEFLDSIKIDDFANVNDLTFFIANGNLYKCKNIFITKEIISMTRMPILPGNTAFMPYDSISSHDHFIFLGFSPEKSKGTVEKYEVLSDSVSLMFLYNFDYDRSYKVIRSYLLADNTVYLDKAPFLAINDHLLEMFPFNKGSSDKDSLIGISSSRVYFIERSEPSSESSSRSMLQQRADDEVVINQNSIKVPEFIKDKSQIEHYIRNEALMLKYEKMAVKIQEIEKSVSKREKDLKFDWHRLSGDMKELEEKSNLIRSRIVSLTEKARNAKPEGDLTEFYKKIEALKESLANLKLEKLGTLKEKLKIQKATLKSKIK